MEVGSEQVVFWCADGTAYQVMSDAEEYECSFVLTLVEDVCGDVEDLIGQPLVVLRWLGTSNGCYSETLTVSLYEQKGES